MLHVVDNLLPEHNLQQLRRLCDEHAVLREHCSGDDLFSWLSPQSPERNRSVHAPAAVEDFETYLTAFLHHVLEPFIPDPYDIEWWCNTNNDLDWHIDKDEAEGRRSGRYILPLMSTVFYPHVSCAGGELLLANHPPVENGSSGPLPTFRSVITIPPVINRLVVFSPGLLHRINPLEGERYSVAANAWSPQSGVNVTG